MNNHNQCLFKLDEMKVLLVDDTPANIDVLSKTLAPEGYKLAIAQDGGKALKIASHFQPNLILLDVMMPGMDGYETCQKLKQQAMTRNIPVIFITAKTETEDIIKGFQSGGVDYMTKPFRQEEVCVRVRTHLQLQASLQNLMELNEQKNHLLGLFAHDLRNPLSGLLGQTEMILDELVSPEEQQDCLKVMRSACHDMLNLVDNVLNVSAIEQGSLLLSTQRVAFDELLENRVWINHFLAEKQQITIKYEHKSLPMIVCDEKRITQVVDNLLVQAIKSASTMTTIFIKVWQENSRLCLSIKNQGQGLSDEQQQMLFSCPHSQQQSQTTQLGLLIAKKVVERHCGQLVVDSQLGVGTEFRLFLPMK